MAGNPRERMVDSAIRLMQERGLSGASFSEVIADSGAPRGSIYHHFPEGKGQLAREAVAAAGTFGLAVIEVEGRKADPVAALRSFIAAWRSSLVASDYRAGCPVAAVVVDAVHDEEIRSAAARAFGSWIDAIAAILRQAGVPRGRASSLATLAVASVEGAVLVCRAESDTSALARVGRELEALIREAIDPTG